MRKSNGMSLMSLIKEKPEYLDRIHEIANEVKKDKAKILIMTNEYNQKYEDVISEGTIRRQILLTEGINNGQTLEEAEISMGFIPSIYTPILNWLYFFMQEEEIPHRENLRMEQEKEYKHLLHENQDVEGMKKVPEAFVFLSGKVTHDQFKKLKKLKALSRSPNEHEAFAAYRKCIELCEFFEVDFDKIPT